MTSGVEQGAEDVVRQPSRVAGRLALLSVVPMLGVVLFAAAGALALRAFSHNNSLACDGVTGFGNVGSCSHYSYAVPIVVGVVGILVVMGGGAFASYYAMRTIGVPLVQALRAGRSARTPSRG